MAKKRVIVIGGGAAGLMAAGQASLAGAEVLILEKKPRPGLKLRITGKGRCNLTNTAEITDFIAHFNAGGKFLRSSFSRFFVDDLIAFFNRIGVATNIERGGRVFPEDNDAAKVVEALVKWAKGSRVKIQNYARVESLVIEGGSVTAVKMRPVSRTKKEPLQTIPVDAVIIATGGSSYPATGSTGDGYALAKALGHDVIPARPALVPIETKGDTAMRLQGLSLRNVSVRLLVDGKKKAEQFGEMIFTHFGLSGPIVLTLSGKTVDSLRAKSKVELAIDLKPALDEAKLDQRLIRDIEQSGKKLLSSILKELMPRKLIPVCAEQASIDPEKPANQISAKERKRLVSWLKDFRFTANGYRPFEEAIITAGGVSTKQVNSKTMESKLVKGLYFAGEVIDIDADTGGFNLQAAFSTGYVAGLASAGKLV